MMPETSSNKTIEVYKCTEFPTRWEPYKVLMHTTAVDATLFHDGELWWLFAGMREHEGAFSSDELCLFYAETPLSDTWTAHPMNPVISDIKRARPAGRLFRHRNGLYRPSQYLHGVGLKLNRITSLTRTEYEEEEVCSVEATWDRSVTALHTFSHAHRMTMIDARLRRRR
jgi:hypothetical protein